MQAHAVESGFSAENGEDSTRGRKESWSLIRLFRYVPNVLTTCNSRYAALACYYKYEVGFFILLDLFINIYFLSCHHEHIHLSHQEFIESSI